MSDDILERFLLNAKVTPEMLDKHTKDGANNPFPPRDAFIDLQQTAKDYFSAQSSARMIALSGLRGIGKTTLMWQSAKEIYDHYSQDIYFFNIEKFVESLGKIKLYSIFEKFEKYVLKKRFFQLERPIVFLLDEVHDAENWSKGLKILYDECPQAFVICTGSSALLLNSNPDLASRWHIFRIYPFNFPEFIQAKIWRKKQKKPVLLKKELADRLKNLLFFSEHIEDVNEKIQRIKADILSYFEKVNLEFPDLSSTILLEQYVNYYNIPRLFSIDNIEKIFEQTKDMFDKILWKDVPMWLNSEKMEEIPLVKNILDRIALSGEVNIDNLPGDSGCTKKQTELFINALSKAEVLNLFLPYGRINAKINKNKKIFFMSPTLRLSLRGALYGYDLTSDLQAILYEEITAMYLKKLLPYTPLSYASSKEKDQKHPDFVIETRDAPILLEVKTKKIDHGQMTQSGIKYRYGILISAKAETYSIVKNTLILPLTWFLLL